MEMGRGITAPISLVTQKRVMITKKKANRLKSKENGQAIIEFALVLPIFLLLVMGIIDFGWLFYNSINVENSARNGARSACVEYTKVCYNEADNTPVDETFTYYDINEEETTVQEQDILNSIKNTLPSNVENVEISIEYTYDDSDEAFMNGFNVEDRYKGDVVVTVTCDYKVLTPVLGITCDNMMKTLTSTSTFKVEKMQTES